MKYLNFNQLGEKLGNRSRSSIYRDLEHGRLPRPLRIGGRLYWPEQQIEEWISKLQPDITSD
ncbi:AlpA family phage regulatory protein [Pseudohalocynthiibacter sp. F2068]|uniref:helix-turn-helix transcriptional regulator n=1 Tax=Pseudohalocynthiibacter sp. F2068 TaxID=2926418 RepID=UPI001FF230A5|nr:AlpA family phage regulatory protein [Pseudohalocynthiibacter sp. F2068]MCK0101980.1 AlpA family phage regulatory protein [Pseudohalocynthiibacter sp. F2068]